MLKRGRGGWDRGRGERREREREREIPAAVPGQVEVVLAGKQRSGEAVAAALLLFRYTPLWFLSLTAKC